MPTSAASADPTASTPPTTLPTIQPTPPAIVEGPHLHTGFFQKPFRRLNLLDAPAEANLIVAPHLAHRIGPLATRALRHLRLKEWVGFGITHDQFYGAVIIQNARYAASAALYLHHHATATRYEWQIVAPPTRVTLPETLYATSPTNPAESRCVTPTKSVIFRHDLDAHTHHITARFPATSSAPPLTLDLTANQNWPATAPLVVSLPIAPRHLTYTHKSPLSLRGSLTLADTTFHFDPTRHVANLDEQKTFYPYRSHWHWSSFGGHATDGTPLMTNFVDQMTGHGNPAEDALWVNGRLDLLPQPAFTQLAEGQYRIDTRDGRVALRFSAISAKREQRNFGLAAIDYAQHYGPYDGTLTDNHGVTHTIRQQIGAFEVMRARF